MSRFTHDDSQPSMLRSHKLAGLALLGLLACATPPKPAELDAFEKLRADPQVAAAKRRAPDLVSRSEQLLQKSREQWQDGDLGDSRNTALMGSIKLKQALALVDQDRSKARVKKADAELAASNEEQVQLDKDLIAAREQVALLQKLNAASADREQLTQQLTAEQQKAESDRKTLELKGVAAERISAAELAMKEAETVSAATYAAIPFSAAADMLSRAQREYKESNFQASVTSAEQALAKARDAASAAKPQYDKETASADGKRKAEELARDAATLTRFEVRRDARGALQRLVLNVPSAQLFDIRKKGTMIAPGKDVSLGAVAELMKKYPAYPVQVIGHTDSRGRSGEQVALSLARAQSVFSALVAAGVEAKRMIVSGQGPAEPVADNKSASGRARNNRIEIVFLYQ